MNLIFDAHLDLSLNAIEWNRDLTQSIAALRESERDLRDKPGRARGTVSLPEMRRGGVGLCVATQLARVETNAWSPAFGWRSPAQAWAMTQGQLAWYRAMEELGEMVQIRDLAGLERHLELWRTSSFSSSFSSSSSSGPEARRQDELKNEKIEDEDEDEDEDEKKPLPIGYILSLEGADSLLTPRQLEQCFADGLRAIGPAHYGPGVYANGTDATGGLNEQGRELLREIDRLGMILDATHLCDEAFWEALDLFHGPVWASHQNVRALVPHMRQFSDEQLRALIARGAVIGAPFDAWMIVPGWERGKTTPQSSGVTLEHVVDHIDHVCQLAGTARHSGIGSDLDGAFGTEQTPQDLDTIADLQKLDALLAARGYSAADIAGIFSRNFITFLRTTWK